MGSHPVLAFLVAAAIVPFVPRRVAAALVVAAPVASFGLLQLVDRDPGTVELFGFELEPLRLDGLSEPFAVVFLGVAVLAGLFGARTMTRLERSAALLYAGAGLAVVLAGDLLTLFVAWEVKAVASAVVIALGSRSTSAAAGMRYLMVHVVGGSALLGGIALRLADGGSLRFDDLTGSAGANLVLVAFLLSAAVPPLHAWLPDTYPEASIAGTVFLSAYTTKAAVYALARGFEGTEALVVLGVFMALYGVVYAVLENEIRRLLGYHIVSQVGFMVAAVGIGGPLAISAAVAHAFAHILYKGLLFMTAGALIEATGKRRLSDLGGLARSTPVLLGLYLVGALSISGLPLLSGFVSKELVVEAARVDGREVVVQLLKLASVGTFLSVGLKLPWFVWGGPSRQRPLRRLPATMVAAMAVTAALNVAIGLHPALLYDLLPHAIDYTPYAGYKVVEVLQLLSFTALGFWLLAKKLGGEPSITLDTDWLYRASPARLAGAAEVVVGEVRPRVTAARTGVHGHVARTVQAFRQQVVDGPGAPLAGPPPTTLLGAVLLGAFLLLLAGSVLA
jgi:multicomponent Na+:H+ antiporter subunit D